MPKNSNTQEQMRTDETFSAVEFAPQRYSRRSNAITTIKLLAISGGVVGLLWAIDLFVSR